MIASDQGQRLARTRHALTIAPDVIAHIVAQRGEPTRSTQPRVQQSKEPPAPINVDAVDDSDYVYQALTYWAGVFVKHLDVVGPRLLRQPRRANGIIVGFPSTITDATAHDATKAISGWMLERLDRFAAEHPFELTHFAADIDTIHTLRSKWPIEEGGTQSQVPCPHHDDDKVAIVIYAPLEYGMPRVIVCDRSHYYDEDEFTALHLDHIAKVKQEIIDRKRSARMMNDLMKRHVKGVA